MQGTNFALRFQVPGTNPTTTPHYYYHDTMTYTTNYYSLTHHNHYSPTTPPPPAHHSTTHHHHPTPPTHQPPFCRTIPITGCSPPTPWRTSCKPYASFRDYRLNSLGFRGPEVRPGGTRVVCIGASETFGLYEDPGQEFPRQIEYDLNAKSPSMEFQVVNAGLVGQTIRTAAVRIPQYVQELHPQFAVIYPTPANCILAALDPKSARSAAGGCPVQVRATLC